MSILGLFTKENEDTPRTNVLQFRSRNEVPRRLKKGLTHQELQKKKEEEKRRQDNEHIIRTYGLRKIVPGPGSGGSNPPTTPGK